MKMPRAFGIVFVGFASMLLYACAIYPRSGSPALIGAWTNSLGTVWAINGNETFDVDLNHDGKRDAWGSYAVEEDKLIITGTGGRVPKDCKGNGVYRFNRGMNTLRFTLVHDNCKLRVKNVLLVWHRK
jgi:hypothetical protein